MVFEVMLCKDRVFSIDFSICDVQVCTRFVS